MTDSLAILDFFPCQFWVVSLSRAVGVFCRELREFSRMRKEKFAPIREIRGCFFATALNGETIQFCYLFKKQDKRPVPGSTPGWPTEVGDFPGKHIEVSGKTSKCFWENVLTFFHPWLSLPGTGLREQAGSRSAFTN